MLYAGSPSWPAAYIHPGETHCSFRKSLYRCPIRIAQYPWLTSNKFPVVCRKFSDGCQTVAAFADLEMLKTTPWLQCLYPFCRHWSKASHKTTMSDYMIGCLVEHAKSEKKYFDSIPFDFLKQRRFFCDLIQHINAVYYVVNSTPSSRVTTSQRRWLWCQLQQLSTTLLCEGAGAKWVGVGNNVHCQRLYWWPADFQQKWTLLCEQLRNDHTPSSLLREIGNGPCGMCVIVTVL